MKNKKLILLFTLLLCTVFLLIRFNNILRSQLRYIYYDHILKTPLINQLPRVEVDCSEIIGPDSFVAFTFGQSNAANYGTPRFTPKYKVYNVLDDRCFIAKDPMLGATGDGGSVWSRLGDKLLKNNHYKNAFFITVAVGSSQISQWTEDGIYFQKIVRAINNSKKAGLKITHVLWHQGEADAHHGNSYLNYLKELKILIKNIRDQEIDAPFFVSVATYCKGDIDKQIQKAQKSIVDFEKLIFPGPNTDQIISSQYRRDDCHFTQNGLNKFADMWFDAIQMADKYIDR